MNKTVDVSERNMDSVEALLRDCVSKYGESLFLDFAEDANAEKESVSLLPETEEKMSARLLAYPPEARFLLFGTYCFRMTDEDIKDVFEISNPAESIAWYKRLLADECGLNKHQQIRDESMRRISERTLETHVRNLEAQSEGVEVSGVKGRTKIRRGTVVRYIAAAAAVLVAAFTVAVSASAEFRERTVKWFIQTFEEYSSFHTASEADTDRELTIEEARLYQPTYIPEGYTLWDSHELLDEAGYSYADKDGWLLSIIITLPSDNDMYVDTEGMKLLEMEYGGEKAYFYYSDEESRFMFSKDGYPMYVLGRLDLDESIKVANGIQKITITNNISMEVLKEYQLTEIPERYHPVDEAEAHNLISHAYLDEEGHSLVVVLQLPGSEMLVNTEDRVVEQIVFNGEDAWFIQDETDFTILSCVVDGFPVYIAGYIDREEAFSIANGIRK